MKTDKKILIEKLIRYPLFILGGIFLGWLLFHSPLKVEEKLQQEVMEKDAKATIWTCAMHPQIRMSEPGKCPICGMELIPLNSNSSPVDSGLVMLSKEAAELADVLTSKAERHPAVKEIRLYGKVMADERLLQSQVAHVPGRIEKLLVNFNGESVHKGQTLAIIYSPELITAQQELLEAAKTKQTLPQIYDAAKEKLHQWKITDKQIESIEDSGSVQNSLEVSSNTNGIVTAIQVQNGDYVTVGTVLYQVADLSGLWLMFDAYESDLQFLGKGDKVTFTVQALPGKTFSGNIAFIDPVINPTTRVAKVRVEVTNEQGKLKPEMFATGIVSSNLQDYSNNLVIPGSAVLWTGKRSIVYVKEAGKEEPSFKLREIELGPMLGDSYVVISGLTEGEELVTNGAFSVDAAAQLEGKTSMMNQPVSGNLGIIKESMEVSGNCEMCKDRIEKTVKSVIGVATADWDVKTKKLTVGYDKAKTDLKIIAGAVADSGHDNQFFRAEDSVYKALPECCLYRK